MKKDYAVNMKTLNSDDNWKTADLADWFDSYSAAFEAAEKAFEETPEILETVLTVWVNGEVDGEPLHMVLEDGNINQYQGGIMLWA